MTAKAAVLVIDNKTGFAGIDASVMNAIGKEVFSGLLKLYYDEVTVVIAHDRRPANNEVVRELKNAASKFGVVDMYVSMHTNMDHGQLAEVPISAFLDGLTPAERAHLRFLYNMGCGDGNEVAFIGAQVLGFNTFLGHKGDGSASPLFAYPALKDWLAGQDKISKSSQETYSTIKKCLPLAGDELLEHLETDIKELASVALKCAASGSEISESDAKRPIAEVFKCVKQNAGKNVDELEKALGNVMQCMPEIKDFAVSHTGLIDQLAEKMPVGMVGYLSWVNEERVDWVVDRTIKNTEPMVFGADIMFGEEPAERTLSTANIVAQLTGIMQGEDKRLARDAATLLVGLYPEDILEGSNGILDGLKDKDLVLEIKKDAVFELVDRNSASSRPLLKKILCDLKGDKDIRNELLMRLEIDVDSTLLVELCKDITMDCSDPNLKLAAYMFLYDEGAITDKQFETGTGKKRSGLKKGYGTKFLRDPSLLNRFN